MKDRKKNNKGSIFTMLLANYAIFTMLMLLVVIGVVEIYSFRNRRMTMSIDTNQIHYYDDILTNGEYKEFPVERLLGKNGKIIVLDELGRSIYPKNTSLYLSDIEINVIPNYIDALKIQSQDLVTEGGQIQHSVSMKGKNNNKSLKRQYIFDENYNIIYNSHSLEVDALTKREYELLIDKSDKNYSIQKYCFKSDLGKLYTLLLYQEKTKSGVLQSKVNSFITDSVLIFILSYLGVILIFILWLNQKIKKPLTMLCLALNEFQTDEQKEIEYSGPREFNEIVESFNAMSKRLTDSEIERKKLTDSKQKMLADIYHDLKTPITVIEGYATALNDGVVPKSEINNYLSIIVQKSQYLNELINTFHEYSVLEHPNYTLVKQRVDIYNYLRDYVAKRYNEFVVTEFELDINIPEEHVYCEVDVRALQRVFTNILANAIKYNGPGTKLLISISTSKMWVRILLADNGVGIPEEIRDSLFEPFVLGEKSRTGRGSGLGLSIAKRIVEAHGGMIRLMTDFPKGYKTTFEIMLPLTDEEKGGLNEEK